MKNVYLIYGNDKWGDSELHKIAVSKAKAEEIKQQLQEKITILKQSYNGNYDEDGETVSNNIEAENWDDIFEKYYDYQALHPDLRIVNIDIVEEELIE